MIPAPFDYVRPDDIDGCVAALVEHGSEAKILAGGHSLLPLMKLRFAYPEVLVDVSRIPQLRGVREEGDHLVIGAATTHHEVVTDPLIARHCAVLAQATNLVGDPQVRHRGTFGGSLAHGDAAGDLPAVAVALEAVLVVRGPAGERSIPATDFFRGHFETALAHDELVTEVRVPKLDAGHGARYEKFVRASHMWAIVGVCAVVRHDGDQVLEARVGLTNMGAVPIRARATEQALSGGSISDIGDAADLADEATDPPADLNADVDYRRHLARVFTRRALEQAVG